MINVGRLRTRITIERASYTVDAVGGQIPTWSTFQNWWVELAPISGRELDFARSFAATVTHKVVMRFCRGLSSSMRLRLGTRIFAINGVIDVDERHRENNLFCTEILNPIT